MHLTLPFSDALRKWAGSEAFGKQTTEEVAFSSCYVISDGTGHGHDPLLVMAASVSRLRWCLSSPKGKD